MFRKIVHVDVSRFYLKAEQPRSVIEPVFLCSATQHPGHWATGVGINTLNCQHTYFTQCAYKLLFRVSYAVGRVVPTLWLFLFVYNFKNSHTPALFGRSTLRWGTWMSSPIINESIFISPLLSCCLSGLKAAIWWGPAQPRRISEDNWLGAEHVSVAVTWIFNINFRKIHTIV